MLIELNHVQNLSCVYIESEEVVSIEPSVMKAFPDGKTEVVGSWVHLRHAPSVEVSQHPSLVAREVKWASPTRSADILRERAKKIAWAREGKLKQKSKEAFVERVTLNGPSDAKVMFCELIDNIDTIEKFLDEESCGHGVFEPALKRIRELLAELEPRN